MVIFLEWKEIRKIPKQSVLAVTLLNLFRHDMKKEVKNEMAKFANITKLFCSLKREASMKNCRRILQDGMT